MKFGLIPYVIYVDGAAKGNDPQHRCGGWSFVIMYDGEMIAQGKGGEIDTTNQRMELTAALQGITNAKHYSEQSTTACYEIYSDSAYLVNCYNDGWYKEWIRKGWYTSSRQPVKNQDLWEQLVPYFNDPHYVFIKVKGHGENEWNIRADTLAQQAATEALLKHGEI